MEFNIYNEIIKILNEYDCLLEKVKNQRENNQTQNKETNLKEMNDFLNSDFLKYIFENIKVERQEEENKNNINQNNELDLDEYTKEHIDKEKKINKPKENNDSEENINISKENNNESDENNDDSEENNNRNSKIEKGDEVKEFIKKYYRKIIILTHPDKTSDIYRNEMFKKAKEYSENKFLIGIIKLCFDLKIQIESLNKILMNQIFFDIRVIQQKIIELKKLLNN